MSELFRSETANVGDIRDCLSGSSAGVKMILEAVMWLSNDYKLRCEMGRRQQSLIDGHGAERIANMLLCSNKLYVLYIPKHYGKPSSIPQIIGDFLQKRKQKFAVVISPGYLGDKSAFITKMSAKFNGYVSEMEIYKGMRLSNHGINLLQNTQQGFRNALSIPVTPHRTKDDHRKMIFFNINTPAQFNAPTEAHFPAEDNSNTQTEAILIGSSNFSYETYFGTGKGEADVFLFYDEAFSQHCQRAIIESGENVENGSPYAGCVLSESIAIKTTPQAYLNDIYDEFRRNARYYFGD